MQQAEQSQIQNNETSANAEARELARKRQAQQKALMQAAHLNTLSTVLLHSSCADAGQEEPGSFRKRAGEAAL